MRPPFRPQHFVEGIRAAEDTGAEVVILDSFSHEYDGEGGIMDWADALAESGVKSPGNWKEPKQVSSASTKHVRRRTSDCGIVD